MSLEVILPAGRYVIAVSGGVDSVVLLDILSNKTDLDLIVAHFDHGIRDDSSQDAEFVRDLAKKYNLVFEMKREELGKNVSEEVARERRYLFLRVIAAKYNSSLITAHHNDDVIETIAINLLRGTGWRGLAVLDSDIVRPLTGFRKSDILNYATENNLVWHEDSTNASDKYLRNRLRQKVRNLDDNTKKQLTTLWNQQKELKKMINEEAKKLVGEKLVQSRYFFINIDETSALELLRQVTRGQLTRPQMLKSLYMIKTVRPGKIYQAGGGIEFSFTSRNFMVKMIK